MKCQNRHPLVFEAMQYNGENGDEISKFCGDKIATRGYTNTDDPPFMTLKADIGYIIISIGYYLVKTKSNKIYAYNPDNFNKEFEAVNDNAS